MFLGLGPGTLAGTIDQSVGRLADAVQLEATNVPAELPQLVSPRWADVEEGWPSVPFELPREGVSLVQVSL